MTQRPLLTAYRLALMLTMLFVLNLTAFFAHSLYLGGDATRGKYDHGHFYVKSHGKYTEVTEAQFDRNKLHAKSLIASFVGGLLGALLMWLGPSSATRHEPPEHASYWTAAGVVFFALMVIAGRFLPAWLAWLPLTGLALTILGGALEWFVREWNAETSYADAAAGQ